MAVFSETIKLDDQVSPSAKKASDQVTILSKALESTQKSLVKAQALGNIKQVGKLTKDVEAYKATLSTLPAAENGAAASGEGLVAVLGEVAAGAAAAIAAVAAVGVALGALIYKGAAFAIEATEAKQASLALWDALGQGKIAGEDIDDMLDGLRVKTGIAKDTLQPLTEGFLRMGITGKEALQDLTVAAASAEALTKGGAEAFTKLYQQVDAAAQSGQKLAIPYKKLQTQLVNLGLNIDDLAGQMGTTSEALTAGLKAGTVDAEKFGTALQDAATNKGAGPLQKLANSTSNLGKMLQGFIGDIFEDMGPAIAPFLEQVKQLFGILDSKTQPSGMALKEGIMGFFKQVFAVATTVVPYIKHFLLDLVIYGLKAYIALKPIANAIRDWANSAEGASTLTTVLNALWTAAKAVGVVILVVVGVLVALWAIGVGIAAVFWGLIVAIVAVGSSLTESFMAGVMGAITWLQELWAGVSDMGAAILGALTGWVAGAGQAASDFVQGLVNGILAGGSAVVGAVQGLAQGAVSSFKSALGIKSPSKVMMELGGYTGEGFAMGVEDSIPDVHGAASGIAGAAVSGAQSGGNATTTNNASTVFNVNVVIDGAGKDAAGITKEMVSAVFESYALGMGA